MTDEEFGPPEPIAEPPAAAAIRRYLELQRAGQAEPLPPATAAAVAGGAAPTGGPESFISKTIEQVPVLGAAYNKGVAGLESLSPFFASRHLERGEGDYQSRSREEALKEQQALMAQRAEEHPVLTTAAKFAGPMLGYAALPGAALGSVPAAAATSGAVEGADALARGEPVLKRALLGAAGGGLGAWIGRGIANRFGRGADKAATEAVAGKTQSAFGKVDEALEPLGQLVPGERAVLLRKAGIAGGLKGPKGVEKGVQQAVKDVGEEFGGLIKSAEATGTKVPVSSASANLAEAAKSFQANDYIEPVIEKHLAYIAKNADKTGMISHENLQGVLGELRPTAGRIYNKPYNSWTPHDEAFIASYRALRKTQDEGLAAALGQNAQDVRRYSAVFHDILPIAEKAVHRAEGNHPVGLIGEIQKSKAARDIGLGAVAAATGHVGVGGGLLLKGTLGWLGGQFGKATSPYRANVLTSALSGLQQPAAAAFRSGLPQSVGATLLGGPSDVEQAADEFGPPEPIGPPPPAQVAKRGR